MTQSKNTYIIDRIIAAVIDYVTIIIVQFPIFVFFGSRIPNEVDYELEGWAQLLIILNWFIFTVGLKQLTGATLGNRIIGLKPKDFKTLEKPNFLQSFVRHLLDPIYMAGFGLIGIVTILCTDKRQRLGDLLAKTIVVKKQNRW
ncbi:MAG: RDD family protein [Pedobacter sp.]|nr:MAG: RDD family protein [Pedobacter sp.]